MLFKIPLYYKQSFSPRHRCRWLVVENWGRPISVEWWHQRAPLYKPCAWRRLVCITLVSASRLLWDASRARLMQLGRAHITKSPNFCPFIVFEILHDLSWFWQFNSEWGWPGCRGPRRDVLVYVRFGILSDAILDVCLWINRVSIQISGCIK